MRGKAAKKRHSRKIEFDGFRERLGDAVRETGCLLRAGFLAVEFPRDEDAGHGEIARRLNVGKRIADHNAVG